MRKFVVLLSLGALAACTAPASPPVHPTEVAVVVSEPSCGAHVVAGDADNGKSVCVVAGSDVSILLTAAPGTSWASPTVTGAALGPGLGLPTPYGRVGWQFRAIAAGPATISTTHDAVRYDLHVTVR